LYGLGQPLSIEREGCGPGLPDHKKFFMQAFRQRRSKPKSAQRLRARSSNFWWTEAERFSGFFQSVDGDIPADLIPNLKQSATAFAGLKTRSTAP